MILQPLALAPVLYVVNHLREADAHELFATRANDSRDTMAMDIMRWGPGWVAWHEGHPVAVVGSSSLWPNVWRAWMFATDDFDKIGLGLTRFIKRSMIPGLVSMGAHRCEALSAAGHVQAHRWLKILGATEESRLRRYGRNGEDFLVFRWDRP